MSVKLTNLTLSDEQATAFYEAVDRFHAGLPEGVTVTEQQIRRIALGAWVQQQGVFWPDDPPIGQGRRKENGDQ